VLECSVNRRTPHSTPTARPRHWRGFLFPGFCFSSFSLDEEVRRIAAAGLAEAPGTGWRYSIASDVLGAVIARAASRCRMRCVGWSPRRSAWRIPASR
jgi:hypothetical protein